MESQATKTNVHPGLTRVRRWHWAMLVFVAGYFAFQSIWLHLLWFGFAVALPGVLMHRDWKASLKPGGFLLLAVVFVLGMLLLSFRPGLPQSNLGWIGVLLAIGDSWLLLVFLDAAVRLGRRRERFPMQAMEWMVKVAGITAIISLLVFYWLPGNAFPSSRLQNVVVHFGLAPVLTGLSYAFAGLAAAILAMRAKVHWQWLAWEALLIFAALCSHSRGGVLALAVGFLVLIVVAFRRELCRPLMVLGAVLVIYQWGIPLLLKPNAAAGMAASSSDSSPAEALIARKDAGRLLLYRIIWKRMEAPTDYVLGRGRWANDVVKAPEMHWHAHHPHSVYLATFYRGGAVGVTLLAIVLGAGLLRCWRVARAGQPIWLALACFGLTAFVFDGDDMATLVSMPRFEPLLLWLPLAVGVGASQRSG